MKLRDLINTFTYSICISISGDSCGWCNNELRTIYVTKNDIPEVLKPWLDREVIETDMEKVYDGYDCTPYLDIIIK